MDVVAAPQSRTKSFALLAKSRVVLVTFQSHFMFTLKLGKESAAIAQRLLERFLHVLNM